MACPYQHTVARSASLKGTALHNGETVNLTVKPAPIDHGVRFQRVDLPDRPTIDAHVRYVKFGERATTLAEGNVKVQTIEHLLSALHGMGVDNALVELTGNEAPIVDGSALPYVELLKRCGLSRQEAPARVLEIREPLHFESKSGSIMTIVPDDRFRISCTQVGPNGRFTQYYSTEVTPEIYEAEIARARTFVFFEDVKPLLDKGLIQGGSLENAIVIRGDSFMSKEPLRYQDELVRHKILDIIGDIFLAGCRINGHVIAVKPGHSANTEMTKIISRRHEQMMAMVPPQVMPRGSAVMDTRDVQAVLPHRYPFLMIDRVLEFSGENKIIGLKSVTINEPYFQGHFPGHPVMPGVLQLEAMAQLASILMSKRQNLHGIGYFMSADDVKFRKPVVPGDTIIIEAELTRAKATIGKASARCLVNGEVTSEATLVFGYVSQ